LYAADYFLVGKVANLLLATDGDRSKNLGGLHIFIHSCFSTIRLG